MNRLTLGTLKCIDTEDWTGADECLLQILTDGVPRRPLRKSLNDGQQWKIDATYDFNQQAEVQLWDEDSPDPNDWLGTLTLQPKAVSNAKGTFKRSGAHYELSYSVAAVQGPAPQPADPVEQAIAAFEHSSKPSVWADIPKADLIADIRQTVRTPFAVNQGKTAFCGPAAIVFEVVSKKPLYYVQICQQLYERGQFATSLGKVVKPSDTLRNSRRSSALSIADWLVMASMRDAENAIFPVEATSGPVAQGLTTPWEMKGWAREVLGYGNVDYDSTYLYGEFDAMQKAQQVRNAGGVAFLMINSALVGKPDPIIGYPDHWVSFRGGLVITPGVWSRHDSGHIAFDCYTWGGLKHVDVGEGPFEDYMWGLVTGR